MYIVLAKHLMNPLMRFSPQPKTGEIKKMSKARKRADVQANLHHTDDRTYIPSAEMEPVLDDDTRHPMKYAVERRERSFDPQLVWRGKDKVDWNTLSVTAPPLYIQEKIHPKALIDDLICQSKSRSDQPSTDLPDLFADFNGVTNLERTAQYYQHTANWTNRMILGDALHVMASLTEREGLRGKVQCVYMDPPYGIKFNSNFQWSTNNRAVIDGKVEHVTREPEMIKAFRDTWKDTIHSYLSYLRERLTIARDLLSESGSMFLQIGDDNVHRVRVIMDEVFGEENRGPLILLRKKGNQKAGMMAPINDYIIWHFRNRETAKFNDVYDRSKTDGVAISRCKYVRTKEHGDISVSNLAKVDGVGSLYKENPTKIHEKYPDAKLFQSCDLAVGGYRRNQSHVFEFRGKVYDPGIHKGKCWKHTANPEMGESSGMMRIARSNRVHVGRSQITYVRMFEDFSGMERISNWWDNFGGADDPVYVVQTNSRVVERCILLCTDPGDLVLDPTCGSGTTAYAAELWGRRWITMDTSRVALALARKRIMSACYPYYMLVDTPQGVEAEAKLRGTPPTSVERNNVSVVGQKPDIRKGFVYKRYTHLTSTNIANNDQIDAIWNKYQNEMDELQHKLNKSLGVNWEDWQIPSKPGNDWSSDALNIYNQWVSLHSERQASIDESNRKCASVKLCKDDPLVDNGIVRVAGPFTIESMSPHRYTELQDSENNDINESSDFHKMVLDCLSTAGVKQSGNGVNIEFECVEPWPGKYISAVGYLPSNKSNGLSRVGIMVGPEFGTIQRADLIAGARECAEYEMATLIACGFSFSAHCVSLNEVGRVNIMRAKMNPDLHMAEDLKNDKASNLFVVFGEPDIQAKKVNGGIRVSIAGLDVFDTKTGEVKSCGPDGIACWFIDTDYNEESFFIRQAYFLGSKSAHKKLMRALNDEVDEEAWQALYTTESRVFEYPQSGRFAVKAINVYGDEVMKVFHVDSVFKE